MSEPDLGAGPRRGGVGGDVGKLMGTLINEIDALLAAERDLHADVVSALSATSAFGTGATSRNARAGMKKLAGGADPGAGQTVVTKPPGGARPAIDPNAGQLGAQVPRTVEEARGAALQNLGSLFGLGSAPTGSPTGVSRLVSMLAGTTTPTGSGHGSGSPGGGGSGGGGGGGGSVGGGGSTYVPGYGYYGGPGLPYGGGGLGRGGRGGGIPPSGGGGGRGGGHGGGNWLLRAVSARMPVVGVAAFGIQEQLSQRNKNAYYQNVEGGGNFAGFGERLSEEAYRWSTMGMFSSQEAREAFKGVTRIGYNGRVESGHGPGRQDALNFVYHGKSSYGATVDESLMTLQEASKTTQTSLTQLSGTLKQLSDDAGKAGVNAQMARSQMMAYYSQALSSGYGSGAVSAAGTISDTLASYGRSYADSSAAGQLTASYGRYAAAQAGMTYGQLTALQKTNPQAAANIRTGVGLQAIAQVLTPQMQQYLQQRIAASGGRVDEATSLQIASDFLSKFGRQIDPEVITGQLSALTGIQFSDYDHAIGWVAMQMAGNTEASRATNTNTGPTSYTGMGRISSAQASQWGIKLPGSGSPVAQAVSSGGTVDPVLAAIAQKVGDPTNEFVMLQTGSGQRVMSVADAMKQFPNELASGQATFLGKHQMITGVHGAAMGYQWAKDSMSGKSVSDVMGSQVDASRNWASEASAATTSGFAVSQVPLAQQYAAANAASTGQVTIGLTADARKLLTVLGQTGTAGAAGESAPPLNPFASNPSVNR